MTRQPSRPRVTIAPSPSCTRNFTGIASLPLLSRLWANSPKNIDPHDRDLSPFGPTYPHVYPQWAQYTAFWGRLPDGFHRDRAEITAHTRLLWWQRRYGHRLCRRNGPERCSCGAGGEKWGP